MRKVRLWHFLAFACLGVWSGCGGSNSGSSNSSSEAGTSASAGTAGEANAGGTAGTAAAGSSGSNASGSGGEQAGGGTGGEAAGNAGAGAGGDPGGAGGTANAGAGGEGGSGGLAANACPAANASLCWDFEEGTIPPGWTASRDEFSGQLLVDTSMPHRGMYSLHAKDLLGGIVAMDGGPKKSIKYNLPANFGPVLWGRAYIYITPEAPQSHAGLFSGRYPRPNSTDTSMAALDWYEVASYTGKYMSIWHVPEPPGYPEWVKVSDTPLVIGNWFCLEWEFDGANGNEAEAADPRVWLTVDGAAMELNWPNEFTFNGMMTTDPAARPVHEKATNFTMIETGVIMYQGVEVATSWWIDDLAIGTQRIGCN